jgi:hypothetical protein
LRILFFSIATTCTGFVIASRWPVSGEIIASFVVANKMLSQASDAQRYQMYSTVPTISAALNTC